MNLRFLSRLLALMLAVGLPAYAQFPNLGDLKKNLLPGGDAKTKKTTDTISDIGKASQAVAGYTAQQENDIGESVSLEIVSRYGGLLRDAAIMRRVNLVGRAVAYYSDRPELTWRFGVLNSDTVNAFSAPGGYVYITRGLYAMAKNDDELAGILGHEIAHVTAKHGLSVLRVGEGTAVAANQLLARSGTARQVDQVAKQVPGLDTDVGKLMTALFENGYGSQKEYDADRLGHNLAASTGYAPGGLRTVLVQLQQRGGDSKKMFAAHPPLADRIKRLPDEPAPK